MNFTGKFALVTGGASGIGLEIAKTFACQGAMVCIADNTAGSAEMAAAEIGRLGGAAIPQVIDVTDEFAVEELFADIKGKHQDVDILVSNAGIQHLDTIETLDFETWKRVLSVHLDGAFLTSRAFMKHARSSGHGGAIILMGSVHSYTSSIQKGPYVVAKHGLVGLCRTLAKEGASYGVRANAICPGVVRTPLIEQQIPALACQAGVAEQDALEQIFLQHTIDGEFTTVQELAEVAVFLAGYPTNALSGQSVCVSHGMLML